MRRNFVDSVNNYIHLLIWGMVAMECLVDVHCLGVQGVSRRCLVILDGDDEPL